MSVVAPAAATASATAAAAPAHNPSFNSAEIRAELFRLRQVHPWANLGYIAFEYASLALVIGLTVIFGESRSSWGIPWAWNVPVFALAMLIVGAIQHRLAGLGHEASHYTLLPNKWANDFVGDLFCMIPILSSIHFYRLFHMAHHQFTNDPERDPDLINLGPGKCVDEFPMPRWRVVVRRMLAPLFAPASFVRFGFEYLYVNVLGKGNNIYMRDVPDGDAANPWPRVGTWLGIAYLAAFSVVQNVLMRTNRAAWLVPAGLVGMALVAAVSVAMPDRWIFRSPFRQAYSERFAGVLRMGYFTALLVAAGLLFQATNGRSSPYVYLVWLAPLVSTLPYCLLLRDTFQHTNADDGRLTNTRVFYCDPITRWAVFVYGQDMHVPHHLFPAIPHYHLPRLHRLLKDLHPEYARDVVECHGTFANDGDRPTILDVLTK